MKKKYLLWIAMVAIGCMSCNNEWEDEQFTQLVSFKATLNSDGVSPIYVRYQTDGVKRYDVPVLVSGSTVNSQDRTVHIGLDPDKLVSLNLERFGTYRTELYYKQLDPQYYTMPETVKIPAGQRQTLLPIDFTLGGMDNANPLNMVEQYVLPLTIKDDESYDYESNKHKHYRKALLNVIPFNDYSGIYDGSKSLIYLEGQKDAFTVSKHKAYVYNDNTIFFYMGLRDANYIDRKYYKLFVEFTDEYFEGKYKLKIWTDNGGADGNNFALVKEVDLVGEAREKQPLYTITEEMDATKPYLKHVYYTLYIDYTFEDSTSATVTYSLPSVLILDITNGGFNLPLSATVLLFSSSSIVFVALILGKLFSSSLSTIINLFSPPVEEANSTVYDLVSSFTPTEAAA